MTGLFWHVSKASPFGPREHETHRENCWKGVSIWWYMYCTAPAAYWGGILWLWCHPTSEQCVNAVGARDGCNAENRSSPPGRDDVPFLFFFLHLALLKAIVWTAHTHQKKKTLNTAEQHHTVAYVTKRKLCSSEAEMWGIRALKKEIPYFNKAIMAK